MILYRADTRTPETMRTKFRDGFKAWCPLTLEQARKFAQLFAGSTDSKGLPPHLVKQFGKGAKLNDLSAYIKWTKNKTSTVWISTAINKDCGGQSSGATIYEMSIDLKEFEITGAVLSALPGGRKSNLKPSVVLDGDSIDKSTLIAINHGPVHDAEVAFLTTIPINKITRTHLGKETNLFHP